MSDDTDGTEGPLQTTDTYSGKLFWLNPPSGKTLDLDSLRSEFYEKTFEDDISKDFDLEGVIVPSVFEKDGHMVRTTTTENVSLVTQEDQEILFGDVILDNVEKITYRDKEILVLDTTKASFMVFESQGFHYLCVLASRDLASTIIEIFRSDFPVLGSILNKTRLGSDAISDIGNSLDAVLMDTIITDYDQTEITQTRIQGENYEDTSVYDQLGSDGKVKSHMFQTDELVPDDTKTILIGRDGLVRIYSNATLRTYLSLLQDYVIPEVHRDVESSPSVEAWGEATSETTDSIFKNI